MQKKTKIIEEIFGGFRKRPHLCSPVREKRRFFEGDAKEGMDKTQKIKRKKKSLKKVAKKFGRMKKGY